MVWRPNPGPQTAFLRSTADEALYGGAAGGGKSAALLACPLRWVGNPHYRGLYLRREASYLGEAIDKSQQLYPLLGGKLVRSPNVVWTFPSGATLWFNHCAHDADIANYDSFEFSEVLFDELTHFTERQYRGIRARLRGTDRALPYWSRAGTNPGGIGHGWVKHRFGAWLDRTHPHPAAPGEKRWYIGDDAAPSGTPDALSRTFVPARLRDNPHVAAEYAAQLRDLDPVRRAQLLEGDWDAVAGSGAYFHRTWWQYVDRVPATPPRARVRSWDFAGSIDGDWTVGLLFAWYPDAATPWVVEDVVRLRGTPGEVHATVKSTASRDGRTVRVTVPQDPGQAGIDQAGTFVRELAGFDVRARRPTGDKVTRAKAVSAQVEAGHVALVRAHWTHELVEELHAVPEGTHDDQMDALSDAFNELTGHASPAYTDAQPPLRRPADPPRFARSW